MFRVPTAPTPNVGISAHPARGVTGSVVISMCQPLGPSETHRNCVSHAFASLAMILSFT